MPRHQRSRSEDVRIFHKEGVFLSKAGYAVYLVQQGESYEKGGMYLTGYGEKPASRLRRMLFAARRTFRAALTMDADVYHLHSPELLPCRLQLKKWGKSYLRQR